MRFEVPAAIAEQVRNRPVAESAVPRDAATVVLLRDRPDEIDSAEFDEAVRGGVADAGNGRGGVFARGGIGGGIEVYLLRRVAAMAAFGGMTVFPGGGVDPSDLDPSGLDPSGLDPSGLDPSQLSASPALARGLICAAVRETFEESGVLLAGPDVNSVVGDTSGAEWEEARRALESRELSLSELLLARGLVLRSDLLRPWAHWITPETEPRRFDTRFFVAALPPEQRTRNVAGEADQVAWVRPAEALAEFERGERIMVPPTAMTLAELAEFSSVAEVLDATRDRNIEPVLPRLVPDGDGVRFVIPGDPGYGGGS
jgi:8-oxo-dGTP pyrophosphatase MutT (NUDIX family)